MKQFFLKHWLKFVGILVGALGGYIYYRLVGCSTGSCPITSNPYRMSIYGALMGFLLFDMFKKNPTEKKEKEK